MSTSYASNSPAFDFRIGIRLIDGVEFMALHEIFRRTKVWGWNTSVG